MENKNNDQVVKEILLETPFQTCCVVPFICSSPIEVFQSFFFLGLISHSCVCVRVCQPSQRCWRTVRVWQS